MDKDMEFIKYSVGDKFDKKLEKDGAVFEVYDHAFNMVIAMSDFTDEEIKTLEMGNLDIYLSVVEGIIFITAKFGDKFILDMPFNAGLYKEFDTELAENTGIAGAIFIIDNNDNTIKAMRGYGFDANFTKYLYKFSKQQRENRINDYDEHVKRVYERYTPADIINFAIAKNVARRIV